MRLTTRNATSKSCRCEPRFCLVRWSRRVLWVDGVSGELEPGEDDGLCKRCVKVWWLQLISLYYIKKNRL